MDIYRLARKTPVVNCIICGERPKVFGELCKECAAKFEIYDEMTFRLSYPVMIGAGYMLMERIGELMRNDDARPLEKDRQKYVVSIAPTLGYVPAKKFLYFHRLLQLIKDIDGDIVECGVGWGESLLQMSVIISVEQHNRQLWGFDSFEGWPSPTEEDSSPRNTVKGDSYSEEKLGVSPLRMLKDTFSYFGIPRGWLATHVTLVKGWFDKCLGLYTGNKIALLHLDCDLHDSYKLCLEAFFPKVVVGGIIACDEYAGTFEQYYFPGARLAIDNYLSDKHAKMERDRYSGKYYFIKIAE